LRVPCAILRTSSWSCAFMSAAMPQSITAELELLGARKPGQRQVAGQQAFD
jgi:hypothetical protein